MPELPEVEALASFLRERAVGRAVQRADVAAFSAVKTYDPPLTALPGAVVSGASRYGKFLSLDFDEHAGALHLVTHLARGGWLQWRDSLPPAPPRPGRGPLAFRLHLAPEFPEGPVAGFDLTEMGTKKGLAVYLVRDVRQVPGIARLGPDAMSVSAPELVEILRSQRGQLKGTLTDQRVLAGIGNAYSDEILHVARLSPFKIAAKLTEDESARLHEALHSVLADAVARSVGQRAATLKGEKRSGLRVHARAGLPCPVCGDTVRSISFADKHFEYCPTCQTEGRELADRRLSKLLK
jgi:formamidopyrimidine-DNA glycosylase